MKLLPEEREAADFVQVFGRRWPKLRQLLLHFPNERRVSPGVRGFVTHRVLKGAGFRKGVADYLLAVPAHGAAGLWLELKADGGELDDHQADFLEEVAAVGYRAAACWGYWSALQAVQDHLAGPGRFVVSTGAALAYPYTRPMDSCFQRLLLADVTKAGKPRTRSATKARNAAAGARQRNALQLAEEVSKWRQ